MSEEHFITTTRPTRKFFEDKWFIRDDFRPEPFKTILNGRNTFSTEHFINMYESGNCFCSREDATNKCNGIRSFLGVKLLNKK